MRSRHVAAVCSIAWAPFAMAQDVDTILDLPRSTIWQATPAFTSAHFVQLGADHLSAVGLSWPDGRQAIVTFWYIDSYGFKGGETFRCIDYFDAAMQSTGGVCYTPKSNQ